MGYIMAKNTNIDELLSRIQNLNKLYEKISKEKENKIKKILNWAESELDFKRCAIFDISGLLIEAGFQKDDVDIDVLGAYGVQLFNISHNLKDEVFRPLSSSNLYENQPNDQITSVKIKEILLETNLGTLFISPLPFPKNLTIDNNSENYIGFVVILLEQDELYNLGIIKINIQKIVEAIQKELIVRSI